MLASTVTSYPSPIHGQSIEVVLYGQEHDGPQKYMKAICSSVIERFLLQGNCWYTKFVLQIFRK